MIANNDKVVQDLVSKIQKHDELYHQKHASEISDTEYDLLREQLKKLDPDHAVLRNIGEVPDESRPKVAHDVPMLSIEKIIKEIPAIEEWATRTNAFKFQSPLSGLVACYKVDGSSCSLKYSKGHLTLAATRGSGRIGNDITENAKRVAGVLKQIPLNLFDIDDFEVRGEIYMPREAFEIALQNFDRRLAEGKVKADEVAPKNPRNFCAGTIMLKDPEKVEERGLKFLAHGYVGKIPGADQLTEYSALKALQALGFETPPFQHVENSSQIPEIIHRIDAIREDWEYDIDGIVFTVNEINQQNALGFTDHHPKYKIAYKYGREQGVTTVLDIKWVTSRSGSVCPTLILKPIPLGGAMVSKCTVHNAFKVLESGIRKGDEVTIEREVIPHLVNRIGEEIIPLKCPNCDSDLEWDETRTHKRCVNLGGCPSQLQDYLEHYVSREAANIVGLGEGLIKKFVKNGLISNPADFYKLTLNDLLLLDKVGDKSGKNILSNINKAKNQKLSAFIVSLGLRGVGKLQSGKLARYFGTLEKLQKASPKDLLMGKREYKQKMIYSIAKDLENRAPLIESLLKYVKIEQSKPSGGELEGQSFCITGVMSFSFDGKSYSSRPAIEELIESKGGSVKPKITSKITYLIAGEGGGEKRNDAQKLGVKIINPEEFLRLLQSGTPTEVESLIDLPK